MESARWMSGSLAVGDGAAAVVVVGLRDDAGARQLIDATRARLDALRGDPWMKRFGVAPFLSAVKLGQHGGEVHMGFGLDAQMLGLFVERVQRLVTVAGRRGT
jgi:hypothetical protein